MDTLETYSVIRSTDWPEWLIVTCPKEDCGQPFVVNAKAWRKPFVYTSKTTHKEVTITGRSCPYCMRVSRVPKRIPR